MRVLIFTIDEYEGQTEFWCLLDLADDDARLSYLALLDPEIITESSRRWPAFGESDEDRGYYIRDSSRFIRFCEMFDLEYDTLSAF